MFVSKTRQTIIYFDLFHYFQIKIRLGKWTPSTYPIPMVYNTPKNNASYQPFLQYLRRARPTFIWNRNNLMLYCSSVAMSVYHTIEYLPLLHVALWDLGTRFSMWHMVDYTLLRHATALSVCCNAGEDLIHNKPILYCRSVGISVYDKQY